MKNMICVESIVGHYYRNDYVGHFFRTLFCRRHGKYSTWKYCVCLQFSDASTNDVTDRVVSQVDALGLENTTLECRPFGRVVVFIAESISRTARVLSTIPDNMDPSHDYAGRITQWPFRCPSRTVAELYHHPIHLMHYSGPISNCRRRRY